MTHRDRVRHRGDCRDFALPDLGGDRTEEPCLQLAATFAIPGASLGHDAHLHNPRLRRSTVRDAPHPFDRPALGAHGTAALWTRRTFPSTHFRAVVRPLLITLSGLGPPSAIALPSVDLFFPHVLGRRACLRDRARVCVCARARRACLRVCASLRVYYIFRYVYVGAWEGRHARLRSVHCTWPRLSSLGRSLGWRALPACLRAVVPYVRLALLRLLLAVGRGCGTPPSTVCILLH